MKIFVISLQSRLDRREFMRGQLTKYKHEIFYAIDGGVADTKKLNVDCFYQWRDPLLDRPLTLGEIGCSISHYYVWKLIAESNEPAIILEDDSLLLRDIDFELIESYLQEYDMLYLDYNEMHPDKVVDIDESVHRPYYPYCNNAYVITPAFAKQLVNSHFSKNIIPVDELFPLVNGVDYDNYCLSENIKIKNQFKKLQHLFSDLNPKIAALKDPMFKQVSRNVYGSDTEIEVSATVRPFTVGTDKAKTNRLLHTAEQNNIKIINLGEGVNWEGGDMTGPGGGQKINLLKQYLQIGHFRPYDIILFVDGYDVVINSDLQTIVERFLDFNCDVLFAGEKICWPDTSIESHFSAETPYKYLNSGCYIGYKWALQRLFDDEISNNDDDQLYLQHRFIKFKEEPGYLNLKIDTENYIFQCISGAGEAIKILPNSQYVNIETETCPCILHGNGGPKDKEVFETLYKLVFESNNKKQDDFNPVAHDLNFVSEEIIAGKFLTKEQCDRIISIVEKNGEWKPLDYDKFPAYEKRIKLVDEELFKAIEKGFMESIVPHAEKVWWPLQVYGIRDMFVIKYSQDTQPQLSCHHDASLISGIIKLNDDYEGGDTYFYRQGYSNKDVPVGDIVVWPGQVTHGHEGRPVTSGTKYNLVIWTSRYNGDVNF